MEGPLRHTLGKWSDVRRDVDLAYELFGTLGIATLPHSRIAEYRRLHHEFAAAGHNPANLGLVRSTRLLHAAVEVDQLLLIAKAATANREAWRDRLEALISGPAYPLEAKHESRARDDQYECFVGAVAQLAGFQVQFGEPDVRIIDGPFQVGMAAKRPRHTSTVLKNCRKAVRQIESSGIPGIVALDVSTALFSDFCVNTSQPEGAKDVVALKLSSFVEAQAPHLRAACRDVPVIGILVTAYAPALIYNTPVATIYTTKVWSMVHLASAPERESAWFMKFASAAHRAAFRTHAPDA